MSSKGFFYVFMYVSDLERSRKFYAEMLGWKQTTTTPEVTGFQFGDAHVVIHRDDRPADQRKYGGGMWMALQVDDVNAEHAALRERGVRVGELLDQHWGERQFYFSDPDGYNWSYGQSTRAT
jgi:catechol 2,3-dioxygenase-like lactoylglutathione lyase family enzyme